MEIVLRNACNAFRLLRENVQLRKKFFRFTYCITLPALISKYVRCISKYVRPFFRGQKPRVYGTFGTEDFA